MLAAPHAPRPRRARVNAGEVLTLRVRGSGSVREVQVTAAPTTPVAAPPDDASLGLRLRSIPKVGVEVLTVEPRSRAERAALRPGDVITLAGGQPSPTNAQLLRAFTSLPDDGVLLLAITRGREHRVIAIEK